MLLELHVRDLALVEEVWLELGPGLTVLSGETGAGKTVLVSALKLLLGERADSAMVRQGAPEALVEGRFVLDGREVLVRRRLTAEGRSRCAIDGEMASVSMLADVLGPHLDLHGQHEHQALLSVSHHRGYLDRFIGTDADEALARYRAAFQAAQAACDRLASVERTLAERERRAEYLRFQVADMDAVAPGEGEDAELEARLPRLRFAERLAAASGAAWTALREEGGATDRLATSVGALMQARDLDPALDTIADSLAALEVELQESAAALRD
jgi:DNA repair protein RecN (Recombination protein N)